MGDSSTLEIIVQGQDRASGPIGGVNAALESLGRNARTAGLQLSVGLSAPMGALVATSIGAAAGFQQAMSRIQGFTNTTAADFDLMKSHLEGLAQQMPITEEELANGLYFVVSAGFHGADALKVLDASARAAAAGLGTTQVVADAVTSTLTAYKMGADQASHVTDILTNAVTEGKMAADSFAPALGRVLPIAAAAGISLEQVSASMATMTRTGLSSEEAATALRGVIGALIAPSAGAKKALEGMGLSAAGLRAEIKDKGLLATLQTLMEKTGGNLDQIEQVIPNIRALTGVLSTASSQGDAYAAVLASMEAATGKTDKAFAVASQNWNFAFGILKNALDDVARAIGEQLLPILTPLADSLGKAVFGAAEAVTKVLSGLSPQLKAAAVAFGAVLIAAGPVVLAVGMLAPLLATLLGPVGLVILAVGALAAAWAADFGGIRETMAEVFGEIRETVAKVFGEIQAVITKVVSTFQGWRDMTGSVVSGILAALGELAIMEPKLKPVVMAIGTIVTWLAENLPRAIQAAGQAFAFVRGKLDELMQAFRAGGLPAVGAMLGKWGQDLVSYVRTNVPAWGTQIRTEIANLWANLTGVVLPAIEAQLSAWWTAGLSYVRTNVLVWGGQIKTELVKLWANLTGVVLPAIEAKLSAWWAAGLSYVRTNAPIWGAQIKTALANLWANLTGVVLPAIEARLSAWWIAGRDFVRTNVPAWGAQIRTALTNVWANLTGVVLPGIEAQLSAWWTAGLSYVRTNVLVWGSQIKTELVKLWANLTGVVLPAIEAQLSAWWTAGLSYVRTNVLVWGAQIKTELVKLWANLTGVVLPAIEVKLSAWWAAGLSYVRTNAPIWGAQIKTALANLWKNLTTFDTGSATGLTGLGQLFQRIQPIIAGFAEFFGPVIARIRDALGGLGNSLAPLGPKFQALLNAARPVLEAIGTAAGVLLAVLSDLLGNLLASVIAHAGQIVGGLLDTVTASLNGITQFTRDTIAVMKAIFAGDWAGAWAGAKKVVTDLVVNVGGILRGFLTLIDGIFGMIYDAIINTVNDLLGTNILQWTDLKTKAVEQFEEMKNSVVAKIDGIRTKAIEIWDNIKKVINDALAAISDALGKVSFPNPFAVIGGWIADARSAIDAFLRWLGGLHITNPFSGIFGGASGQAAGMAFAPSPVPLLSGAGLQRVQMGAFGAQGAGVRGQGTEQQVITININHPVVRDEVDIRRLAEQIGDVLARQASVRRRLALT